MNNLKFFWIFFRYFFVLLIGVFGLSIFYLVLTPLTVYPVYWFLKSFYTAVLSNAVILIENHVIEIIGACVAGAAYFLLFILNLTTPMKIKQRIFSLAFSFLLLLIFNIARIILFSLLLISDFSFFDATHKLFWYFLSTIFVVAVWFFTLKIFSISKIPILSDVKYILSKIKTKSF